MTSALCSSFIQYCRPFANSPNKADIDIGLSLFLPAFPKERLKEHKWSPPLYPKDLWTGDPVCYPVVKFHCAAKSRGTASSYINERNYDPILWDVEEISMKSFGIEGSGIAVRSPVACFSAKG